MESNATQRGQALVEVLVLAAAMIPLLLAVPLLAKYQDIRHATIAASRTAAFECSIRPDACGEPRMQASLADDLRRRHFASHDRDLLSADAVAVDTPSEQRNRFWVDRRGAGLLPDLDEVTLRVLLGQSDAARGAWDRAANGGSGGTDGADRVARAAGPGAFGLDPANGLTTAQVRARVSVDRTLAQWLQQPEGMRLALTARTAVFVDAWNASSAKGAERSSFHSRVEQGRRLPDAAAAASELGAAVGSAPAAWVGSIEGADPEEAIDMLYAPIRQLITGPLLAPVEPRGSLFRYHEIDVERVPADRIGTP